MISQWSLSSLPLSPLRLLGFSPIRSLCSPPWLVLLSSLRETARPWVSDQMVSHRLNFGCCCSNFSWRSCLFSFELWWIWAFQGKDFGRGFCRAWARFPQQRLPGDHPHHLRNWVTLYYCLSLNAQLCSLFGLACESGQTVVSSRNFHTLSMWVSCHRWMSLSLKHLHLWPCSTSPSFSERACSKCASSLTKSLLLSQKRSSWWDGISAPTQDPYASSSHHGFLGTLSDWSVTRHPFISASSMRPFLALFCHLWGLSPQSWLLLVSSSCNFKSGIVMKQPCIRWKKLWIYKALIHKFSHLNH